MRGSSIANRILRTFHAPARAPAKNSERVGNSRSKFARRHNGSDSTRRKPAEGSPATQAIRTAPQRERFDTHDPRRGFAVQFRNSHGATTGAIRHARSPQRVRIRVSKFARRHNGSDSTRTIPADGSNPSFKIRTAPQRERFDTHDPRRGLAVQFRNSHGATTGAMRHARSPQRVRCSCGKFARRHNGSDAARTKPAEGALRRFPMTLPRLLKKRKLKAM